MNYKKYTHYIVVDENRNPMSFQDGQFVYCETDGFRNPFPVKLYTFKEAKELIKKTITYRTNCNFSVGTYKLMPVLTQQLTHKNKV